MVGLSLYTVPIDYFVIPNRQKVIFMTLLRENTSVMDIDIELPFSI